MNCKVCGKQTRIVFQKILLNKYSVSYLRCNSCEFVQTEDPYWLDESYSDDLISGLDTGAVTRNLQLAEITERLILSLNSDGKYIDYGGGTGLFVRLMRDRGFDFYWHDMYSRNIFAKYFSLSDLNNDERHFDLLTAFEVFEHLVHPMQEVVKMFEYSSSIFFSTELQPTAFDKLTDWWYLVTEGGQHVSLYSKNTLLYIANYFKLHLYTNDGCFHLLTKEKLPPSFDNFKGIITERRGERWLKILQYLTRKHINTKTSLIQRDFNMIKEIMSHKA